MGRRKERRLDIFMNGEKVGTWDWSRGPSELIYDESWLTSPSGRPISLSLPWLPGNLPVQGALVDNFFDNLLPDNVEIRRRLASRFRAASTAASDLLTEIGRDCVGALQLVHVGDDPGDIRQILGEDLDEAGVAEELRASLAGPDRFDHADGSRGLRISIAGAQEKTALLHHEGRWWRPLGATPTTHILKMPLGLVGQRQLDLRDSVENEWLCAQILAAFGLPVANCEMATFEDFKVLVVERFDRSLAADNTFIARLPQEDLCQATGTPGTLKYEADGGPGMDKILKLLKESEKRDQDRLDFLRAQVIFWMLGAPDGHAKNFSIFLRSGGKFHLTPFYDVMSAWPLVGKGPKALSRHDLKLAMAVRSRNPHWRVDEILPRHWRSLAVRHDLEPAFDEMSQELVAATPRVIAAVTREIPADFPSRVSDTILRGLEASARRLSA